MKNKLGKLLTISAVFLLSACQLTPKIPSSSDKEESQEVSYSEGNLTNDELKTIILKAAQMERDYMSSVVLEGDSGVGIGDNNFSITTYNGGYRLYETGDYKIASYCPSDYSHVYFRMSNNNQPFGDVGDYITDSVNDQYIYAFGYGQIGANPAALVACQSYLCFKNLEFDPKDAFCKKENDNYVVSFNNFIGGETNLYWEMTINNLGQLIFLRVGVNTNKFSGGYRSLYEKRQDAPQEIVDLFASYNQ